MKRILSVLLCCSDDIPKVLAVSAEGGNLLQNGDFNAGTLSGWWMRSDWNGGTWEYSAGEGYEGGGCLIATGVGDGRPALQRRPLHLAGGQRRRYSPWKESSISFPSWSIFWTAPPIMSTWT